MRWRNLFDKTRYQPKPGETRRDFLARLGREGIPPLGYAEAARTPIWELCREVTSLRLEVDALRAEVAVLREGSE
jgi:hypothetical protein